MPDGPADMPRRRARLAPRRAAAIVVLLAVLAVAVLTWSQRRGLAQGYADDLLRSRGVPATYRIGDLGPGGQRLTDVVIGDPRRPDLTADWVETRTRWTLAGPRVVAIRAGRIRMRGRLVGGRLSLGALDRLLPAAGGGPFTVPDIALDVADARMRLDTPAGPVGLKLTGSGGLRGGFDGQMALVAPSLASAGCRVNAASAYLRIRMARGGAPRVTGPVRAAAAQCGGYRAERIVVAADVALDAALTRWKGRLDPAAAQVRGPQVWLRDLGGRIQLAGTARGTSGSLALHSGASAAYGVSAVGARAAGRWGLGGGAPRFAGNVEMTRASVPARWRAAAAGLRGIGAGTPLGPLADRIGVALAAAGRDVMLHARVQFAGPAVALAQVDAQAASGATLRLVGRDGGIAIDPSGARLDGALDIAGGGLPTARIVLAQSAPGAPIVGEAVIDPYRAGQALLALAPVRFRSTPAGRSGFATTLTLSGPMADGRVERATLPLIGGWDGQGRLVVNPECVAGGFAALRVAGVALRKARFAVCPVSRALLTLDRGKLGGGVRLVAPRFAGRLGGNPFTLAARTGTLDLGAGRLRVAGLALRSGPAGRESRLDLAELTGRWDTDGIGGSYVGGAGQVGAVPLLLSDAAGAWRVDAGVLTLAGGLTVADANRTAPRLRALPVRDVRLRLADGRIAARGEVRTPDGRTPVAAVTLDHDLGGGTGEARVTVPGLTFGDRLQPDQLTPVTFGVVSDVTGTVRGAGTIRWTPAGVTSNGTFGTDGLDLAAAFGPVTGLRTTIRFADLLALESAPGQQATIAVINPGVPVEKGVVRFQTLAGARVRIEDARWPLAGGELSLDPTLLDFAATAERRMTFRIAALDARTFLRTFGYDNLDASGVFDGALPIVFGTDGGRLDDGRLVARDGGTLAYRGEVSKENLGIWGNLAFGALRSLRFRALELTLDGPLAGNIVTRARFAGVGQGEGATRNFLTRRLAKLPFVFNVRIEAPFRSLIGSVRSFYDPNLLIEQNLPALIREQERFDRSPVQPPASENKP